MNSYINRYNIVKKLGSALKISSIVSSALKFIHEPPEFNLKEYARLGTTTIPITDVFLSSLFGKLSELDILEIEDRLEDYGKAYGFEIEFVVSETGYAIRLTEPLPDDDYNPDDDEDQPTGECEELIMEEIPLKAMSAHA